MAEEKTFSAKQVATRIGTDAKQLRKFFRSTTDFDAVGQGGRYDFPESMLPEIKAKFDAWNSTKVRRVRKPSSAAPKVVNGTSQKPRVPKPMSAAARAKAGLHGCALDDDPIEFRTAQGIAGRVAHHNLGQHPSGQFFPLPAQRKAEGTDTMTAEQELDEYLSPHGETQPIIDAMEAGESYAEDYED